MPGSSPNWDCRQQHERGSSVWSEIQVLAYRLQLWARSLSPRATSVRPGSRISACRQMACAWDRALYALKQVAVSITGESEIFHETWRAGVTGLGGTSF